MESRTVHWYLTETVRGYKRNVSVLKSEVPLKELKYRFDCKYGDYYDTSMVTQIQPRVLDSDSEIWRVGRRTVVAKRETIDRLVSDHEQLTGDQLSVQLLPSRTVNNLPISDLDISVTHRNDIAKELSAVRRRAMELESLLASADTEVSQLHRKFQEWLELKNDIANPKVPQDAPSSATQYDENPADS